LSVSSWVAAVALALLTYTYVGYPLLIGLLARLLPWRPRPVPGWEPTVSICVAAYNCEAYIEAKMRSLLALDYLADKLEILIYSDASTDGTDAIVTGWAAKDPRVNLLRGEARMGKPTALNRMRERATGEVLVITDARQPLDRAALRALLALLAETDHLGQPHGFAAAFDSANVADRCAGPHQDRCPRQADLRPDQGRCAWRDTARLDRRVRLSRP